MFPTTERNKKFKNSKKELLFRTPKTPNVVNTTGQKIKMIALTANNYVC